jgi:hypothetical protein
MIYPLKIQLMKWSSSKTTARDGFHDAALVEFASKVSVIEVFVRELVQNSLDAAKDESVPVEVVFEPGQITVEKIPDWATLKSIFSNSKKYNYKAWPGAFEIMSKFFDSKNINYLKLTDLNTVGLSKKQNGNDVSSWEACVLADSQSVKANSGSRGSFGIGKNAAFALSEINTVLYDTVSADGFYFGGVSKLGGHTENGINYASKKIIEDVGGRTSFKHPSIGYGLTQTILGISKRNFKKIEILLELYLYKHYLISLYSNNLKAEIKGLDENGNKTSLLIESGNEEEFLAFIRERLQIISPHLKLKAQKADLEHIEQVANSLQKTVKLGKLYDTIKGHQAFLDYLSLEDLPTSWKGYFENTKLNFFPDAAIAKNTIYHYRNGMFIFSKSFSNSFHTPVSIVHDVSNELSQLYSNFETFSHDKWLKNLLKDRLSKKDEIQSHEELFDFQRLIPKFFLIYLAGDNIKEGDTQTEILVNNILSGQSGGQGISKEGGIYGVSEGGELVQTPLVVNGIEQGSSVAGPTPPKGTPGKGKGNGTTDTKPPVKKVNRPLISNRIGNNHTIYKFSFSNLQKGTYSLSRQGLVQRAALNFIEFDSRYEIESFIDGETLILNVDSTEKAEFEVKVGDTLLTQWKIVKQ